MEFSKKISDLFDLNPRFFRSVHLEQDFSDPRALDNYVFTDYSRQCLERISIGLNPRSTQRAWRITGDYGTGKSSFALLLSKIFCGFARDISRDIFHQIETVFSISPRKLRFFPLVITGFRGSLSLGIIKALFNFFEQHTSRGRKSEIHTRLKAHIAGDNRLSDDDLIDILKRFNRDAIESEEYSGILLVIDEMGKFLEYAALYPEQQDLYLLQQLAEMASRSGEKPFFIVSLLHQGFGVYASNLSLPIQREWTKIAGRYEEILFNQPLDQLGLLIKQALNVSFSLCRSEPGLQNRISGDLKRTVTLGWFGASAN